MALLSEIGTLTMIMILLTMLSGYLIGKFFQLSVNARKTLTIEVGMQNGGMALIVTQGVLQNTTMSLVPITYGLIMLIPVGIFVLINRNENTESI